MKHMVMNRVICLLLSALLLLGFFPVGALAAADTTAPKLNGITLEKELIVAPGTIEVIVDASDDISGVSSVSLRFYCKETDKSIYCYPAATYWDSSAQKWVPYADGKLHGKLSIDKYVKDGKFMLNSVNLHDKAGNSCYYSSTTTVKDDPAFQPLPDSVKQLSFTVESSGTADISGPKLKSISLGKTSLNAPGVIPVVVEVEDDNSGVSTVNLRFFCEETGKSLSCYPSNNYWDNATFQWIPYADGKFHGEVEVDRYVQSGKFLLNNVNLQDKAGNNTYYSRTAMPLEDPSYQELSKEMKALYFTVTASDTTDTEGPVLENITLSAVRIDAPGIIDVVVEAKDDVSGISSMSLQFLCEETGKSVFCHPEGFYFDPATGEMIPYTDGNYHGKLEIDQYTREGVFRLNSVNLYDKAGNSRYYNRNAVNSGDASYCKLPENLKDMQFTVGQTEQKPETSAQVVRIAGATRFDTALAAADALKSALKVEQFSSIIVASGTSFPDALAGSYLASVKKAPILLVNNGSTDSVKAYIKKNLAPGGTVYLLGGVAAVPTAMEQGMGGFAVKRLGGSNRYETNLLILKEAGVSGKDMVVCTGKNFADSLSASAVGLPILLVKDSLSDAQKEFLKGSSGRKIVIGGKNAVSENVEKQLSAYGSVKRLAGASRYDTSILVAEEFFSNPDKMVIAYGKNFPDGLSGGPLACCEKAPLILTQAGSELSAATYRTLHRVNAGYVLGGTAVLPQNTVNRIFGIQ